MKKYLHIFFSFLLFCLWNNFSFGSAQTYNIPLAQLVNCPTNCGSNGYYNPCDGSQIGFNWTDVIPGGNTVTSISIQFVIGVECSNGTHGTTLNGVAQSSFADASNCACSGAATGVITINPAVGNYVIGGANQFRISSLGSCIGFYPNWAGPIYGIVTVTYVPSCTAPSIIVQPSNAALCVSSGSANFSITASGTTLSYQWKYWNGASWGNVANGTPAGAVYTNPTSATMNISGITAVSTYTFQCYISNTCGNVTSSNATLTINTASALGTVSNTGPIEFCGAAQDWTAAGPISVSGYNGTITWDWGSDNGTWNLGWGVGDSPPGYCCFPKKVSLSDANADRIRWSVQSGACPATGYSTPILINNHYNEAPTSLTSNINNVCAGTGGTLTATFPTASDILGTVEFFSGSCGGTLIASVAGNGTTTVATAFTAVAGATTYYVRYNPGAGTGCSVTACVSITVTGIAPPTTATNTSTQTICNPSSATLSGNNPVLGTGAWTVVSGPSTSSTQFGSTSVYNTTFIPAGGPGSYVVQWTISNAPCAASSANATITVNNCAPAVQVVFPTTANAYVTISSNTYFVVGNPANNAIINGGTSGGFNRWITSEGQTDCVQWQNITTGFSYLVPFGYKTTDYIPFTFNKTVGVASDLIVSTWGTAASNNLPWAGVSDNGAVAAVSNMYDSNVSGDGSVCCVIDRWWDIFPTAGATANVTFSYRGIENTMSASYNTQEIATQHWTGTVWNDGKGGNGGTFTATGTNGVTSGIGSVIANGLNQFSPYILVAKTAPLPVTWLDISSECKNTDLILRWSTASEQNSNYFTVEQSIDGINFSSVTTITAAGNSNSVKNYFFIDHDAFSGTSFYRIKETDFNGYYSYSNMITTNGCSGNNDVNVYESNGSMIISINAVEAGEYDIEIFSVLGQRMSQEIKNVTVGSNLFNLPLNNPAAGIYFVRLKNQKDILTKKVFVR